MRVSKSYSKHTQWSNIFTYPQIGNKQGQSLLPPLITFITLHIKRLSKRNIRIWIGMKTKSSLFADLITEYIRNPKQCINY